MTSTEKAKSLVDKFYYSLPNNGSFTGINSVVSRYQEAKQCALIAVDEIIDTLTDVMWINNEHTDFARKTIYWQEVQQEIEKLK